jgi:hypothetical protein
MTLELYELSRVQCFQLSRATFLYRALGWKLVHQILLFLPLKNKHQKSGGK